VPNKKFNNVVSYKSIEKEVRCGRYYLRVWISQAKEGGTFEIPIEEEDEFYKNL
jgi:hypothetical protein